MIHACAKAIAAAAIVAAASPGLSDNPVASELFGAVETAFSQKPMPIGRHAQGCIAGAVQLPESGPTWQAMRLDRNRNWGHPELIDYIVDLSTRASELGWNGLYVGDMSQPRGGPMASGHTSHQIGLDVDIWMLPPGRLDLSRTERETISSISVRTDDQTGVNSNWTDTHKEILKAAASDPRVDRILVSAAVKVELCSHAGGNGRWLQKIRPWYHHNYHFHVRLKCPPGSLYCVPQRPTVEELSGDGVGCDKSLEWWVTDYAESLKQPAKKSPPSTIRSAPNLLLSDLPEACREILASD
ncbi:MAG: penicillin-insensitive murein endopeptidase [Albidovulum sp.]|nr:penicillin-insensitive murein endopeptidase [Albidovulum sp.]MDE0306330.1 penicillin-insensitive murein endopeptidase [Albidovulum sp.]MDE0531735.1 penicillin-insensitive murein endopeptidase [Albidovulum sp.]